MGRKLSEVQNEDALDLLADILDPLIEICADEKLKSMIEEKKHTRLELVKYVIKSHKSSVIQILATIEGVPVEEYRCNVLTLPAVLLDLVNDPEVIKLFTLQGQKIQPLHSGPAMEDIAENVQ